MSFNLIEIYFKVINYLEFEVNGIIVCVWNWFFDIKFGVICVVVLF